METQLGEFFRAAYCDGMPELLILCEGKNDSMNCYSICIYIDEPEQPSGNYEIDQHMLHHLKNKIMVLNNNYLLGNLNNTLEQNCTVASCLFNLSYQ